MRFSNRSRRKSSLRRLQNQSGFTLLEVLLVLAILVILASLVGVAINRTMSSGYSKAAKTQIGQFETVLGSYYLDMADYPEDLEGLRTAPSDLDDTERWKGPYLNKPVPKDPWGNDYVYEKKGQDSFVITSNGPDGVQGGDDDISSETE